MLFETAPFQLSHLGQLKVLVVAWADAWTHDPALRRGHKWPTQGRARACAIVHA